MSAWFLVLDQWTEEGRLKRDMALAKADLVLSKSKYLSKWTSLPGDADWHPGSLGINELCGTDI